MLSTQLIEELTKIVGRENVAAERQDLHCYSYDATQLEFLPDLVLFPADANEVSSILKVANSALVPVFPPRRGERLFRREPCQRGGGRPRYH
jgi:glycolate oxidase